MTEPTKRATAPAAPTEAVPHPGVWGRFRAKDPNRLIVKRSARAAVAIPSVFALTHQLFSNPQVSLFAAFGSFALMLFVEFPGRTRSRLVSFVGLFLAGSCLIALGTAVSTNKVAAVVVTGLAGFAVLFAGVAVPQAAAAATAALLTFVLPVSVAGPASAIGPRLLGWTIAAVVCTAACLLVWPPPWHDNLRKRLASAVSAVARLAEARAAGSPDATARAEVAEELAQLRTQFSGTPYPPTGAATNAVALSKLVGRVEWVAGNTAMIGGDHWVTEPHPALAVTEQVAATLRASAGLICDHAGHPVDDPERTAAVQESTRQLDALLTAALEEDVQSVAGAPAANGHTDGAVTGAAGDSGLAGSLDPGFHARALGYATTLVADAALEAAGADAVIDRRFGMADESTTHLVAHRLLSHLSFRSVWFRNALRGAIGLALAVTVIEVTDVQHGFWVVLGTMSVLRSNAMGTGATALKAVGGTALGFVIGAAVMIGVGDHTVLLWVLLPVAVFVSGVAPMMISFGVGQAAFTLMVIILFNIIQPVGWKLGLTRIEDVAIGCGISIVVGFLFWPRGATAALGRALSDAFAASSAYLADAVERLTRTTQHVDTEASQQASHRAYLLLDDAFRQFVTERGAKVVPLDTVSGLFSGSNRLRLAAFTLCRLPVRPPDRGASEIESVGVAEAVLRDSYATTHRWYEDFGDLLADRRESLDVPPPHADVLHRALRQAFDDVKSQQRSDRVQTTLQMLWADEILESQSQLQVDLLGSASLFVSARRRNTLV